MSKSLAIASGKGGVGKTTIAVNLAITQSKISKCLLLDADMGMANAHILLGINPSKTIKEVIDGNCNLENAIMNGPAGVNFISGGSGITELLNIDSKARLNFIRNFDNISDKIDNLIIDVSAGAEETSLSMLSASDRILFVLVNEPTSFMDAFTLIKVCNLEFGFNQFCVTVNMVKNDKEGLNIFNKFNQIITKFYNVNLLYTGSVPSNRNIKHSILKKKPIVLNKDNKEIAIIFERILKKINDAPYNKYSGIKFFQR